MNTADKIAKELRGGKPLNPKRIGVLSGAIVENLEEIAALWGEKYKISSSVPLPTRGKSLHLKRSGKRWAFRIYSDDGRGTSDVSVRHAGLKIRIESAEALPKLLEKIKKDAHSIAATIAATDVNRLLAAFDLASKIEKESEL